MSTPTPQEIRDRLAKVEITLAEVHEEITETGVTDANTLASLLGVKTNVLHATVLTLLVEQQDRPSPSKDPLMITKRTDELCPGDRVRTRYGERTVKSTRPSGAPHHEWGIVFVEYESRPLIPGPYGAYADPDDAWQVVEPSPLDLAVQLAYELVDQYPKGVSFGITDALKDFTKLLDLFRAAR